MVFNLDETCCVSSCVVLRRVAALNFIFPALTTPLSAQAFLGYDVLGTTASSYLKVPNKTFVNFDRVARLKVRLLNGLSWFKTRGGGTSL